MNLDPYLGPVITILGSGFMAYLGVKVAIAEIKGDLKRHEDKFKSIDERLDEHGRRIDRLEGRYFSK